MKILVQLVGLWIARDIAAGRYPTKLAVPLSLLIARLGPPGLVAAGFGLGFDLFGSRSSAPAGKRRARSTKAASAARRTRAPGSKQQP